MIAGCEMHCVSDFLFSDLLQWSRPLFWSKIGSAEDWALNYFYNQSACSETVGCGQLQPILDYPITDFDMRGEYASGIGLPGEIAIPDPSSTNGVYTIQEDSDENGVLHTMLVLGPWQRSSEPYMHRRYFLPNSAFIVTFFC